MTALLDIGQLAKRFDVGGKRLLHAVDEVSSRSPGARRSAWSASRVAASQPWCA